MRNFTKIFYVLAILAVVACGNKSSTGPKANNPLNTPSTPINPGNPTNNPNIPDLTGALNINLIDWVHYSGLWDLSHGVYPGDNNALVTPPLVVLKLGPTRSATVTGSILIAFEDALGFWGAQVNTFENISTVDGAGNLVSIFSDDEFVLKVTGQVQGANITNGQLYYRVRGASTAEQTACKKVTVTCTSSGYWPYPPVCTQPDYITTCRNYMNTTNANVKLLGTIQTGPILWTN